MSGRRQSLDCHGQPFSLKTMRKLTGRWAIWLKVWLLAVTTLRLIGCWLSLPCVWLAAGCHYLVSDWLLAVTILRLIGCWLSLPCVWLAAGCHYLASDWLLAVTTLCLIGCWLPLPCVWLAAGCDYLVSDWLLVGTFSGLICKFLVYQVMNQTICRYKVGALVM